ncbi:nucleotidyltransferase [candidate division KSB1 bacterium]|nr:MAG: nucleotidyltransferase [candidate division KSB1 bacterium]
MAPSLVILAAGMGSRYGGVKQIDQFGPNGETILDYSIYDALKAGFGKIVFVIRRELENDFKAVFGDKLKGRADVRFVFQELDNLPQGFEAPKDRKKPWGTAHAVMVAKEAVNEPFGVINADDFYGQSAYQTLADFLNNQPLTGTEYAIVGYRLKNTLSKHGSVSRGVCQADAQGYLQKIVERTKIYWKGDQIVFLDEKEQEQTIDGSVLVSMNMMGYTPTFFEYLEEYFKKFLEQNINDIKAEFFLTWVLDELINTGKARVKIVPTNEEWFGVTYKEDKPIVKEKIRQLIAQGKYPEKLW